MFQEMLIQSVPNFSEGRDLKKIEQIVDAFRAVPGVKLLDYSTDQEFNRCVVTVVGQPGPLQAAMVDAVGRAVELIDMNAHVGQHPRLGAVDVIPFTPVRGSTIEDADQLAKAVAREVAQKFDLPCYLYEKSASAAYRVDIADIRRGQFEGLDKKMQDPLWQPDFGPCHPHSTAGATIIGARMPLICFNVNLDTPNVELAKKIALRVRSMTGGLRYVKAMGIAAEEQNLAQVTMNLTDYTRSSMYTVFELIKIEARRYGVNVLGSEIVGIVSAQALIDSAEYYLQLSPLAPDQILENMI
jgi:glutamate formiminotransferase